MSMKLDDLYDNVNLYEETVKNYKEYINPYIPRVFKNAALDIIEVRREGAYIWDQDGTKLLDCVTGAGVFNVGRHNKEIGDFYKSVIDRIDLGGWIGLGYERGLLAKKLAEITPEGLKYSFLTNSGGEAVETALKLARGSTGKPSIIATNSAYHGLVGFSLGATGRDVYKKPFEPLMPGYKRIPFNDPEALEAAIGDDTACFIIEPIQGEGGIVVPTDGYLAKVREICTRRGILFIADEVQTGMGRTGKLFAVNHENVSPDILCLSKSLSAGYVPVGAAIFTEELSDFFLANPFIHQSTFGGNGISSLVALKGIDYVIEHDLPGNSARMGARALAGLKQLQADFPKMVVDARGKGLMLGIEYNEDSIGPRMAVELRKHGVISIYSFNNPRVMRIMPTLVVGEAEIDLALSAFRKAMETLSK